jgi:hypothetical protein
MRSRVSRGFTAIELIIIVALFGVFSVLVGMQVITCASSQGLAEEEARNYAAKMRLTLKGVSCMNRDTDGDGYVSCTLNVVEKDGSTSLVPIECAAKWTYNNEGCKEAFVNGLRRK